VVLLNKGKLGLKFIITIPEKTYQEKFAGFEETVINLGPIGIEDCPSVYHYSDFLFLPTLLECFTASYVEAMKMECPILTSDLSFARSVCQKAAMYFNPREAKDILEKIGILVKDPSIQSKLIEEGINQLQTFPNAEKRTSQYLNICGEIHQSLTNQGKS
jgi:glycosyltransferase involved in cell wall biosynthesis